VHGRKVTPLECTLKSEKRQFHFMTFTKGLFVLLIPLLYCIWNSHKRRQHFFCALSMDAHAPTVTGPLWSQNLTAASQPSRTTEV